MALRHLLLLLSLLCSATITTAELRDYQLKHRSAEAVIPLISPFIEPDGSISGRGFQLFIRSSTENLEQIERLIERIDQARAQLRITVRQGGDRQIVERQGSLSGRYRAGDGSITIGDDDNRGGDIELRSQGSRHSVTGRLHSTDRSNRSALSQSLRVTEGEWAYIETGESVPYPTQSVVQNGSSTTVQQGIEYRSVNRGFEVRPRLTGESVTLEVRPHNDTLSRRGGGIIDTRSAATTVSAPLGSWIEIAGSSGSVDLKDDSRHRSTRQRSRDNQSIYLKVERLP